MGKKDFMLAYSHLSNAEAAQPDCVKTVRLSYTSKGISMRHRMPVPPALY
jgi:hypothetical protein